MYPAMPGQGKDLAADDLCVSFTLLCFFEMKKFLSALSKKMRLP